MLIFIQTNFQRKEETKMLRKLFKKLTKPYVESNHKKRNIVLLAMLTICCISSLLTIQGVYAKTSYVLGKKGSAIVAGTKSGGNCTIYPVVHPVFIVRFYPKGGKMSAEDGGIYDLASAIKYTIPYANEDAMWLASSDLIENMSDNIAASGHTSSTTIWVEWKGTITRLVDALLDVVCKDTSMTCRKNNSC